MKKLIVVLSILLILTACTQKSNDNGVSVKEIELPTTNKKLSEFVDRFRGEDGTFLFQDGERQFYILLNDKKATTVYEEFSTSISGAVLSIDVKQRPASGKTEKDASNLRLFKVKKNWSVETDSIQMKVNDEDVPFASAYVR